jgi:hypothetical protein
VTRVVLLGASNVTLSFQIVTRLIRAGFDGRLDVRAAVGHGRSYGAWSSVAIRSLPGIVECGLWNSLRDAEPARTYALLTDVGNDLMYGSSPRQIGHWVETCLNRLCESGTHIIVTRLPLASAANLSAWRYHLVRTSFFPTHPPISWKEMLRRAQELDERLAAAAAHCKAAVIVPPPEWYGFDPIHIRWTHRAQAWAHILSAWPGWRRPAGQIKARGLSLMGRRPERLRLLGYEAGTPQPVVVRPDATLSLF